MRKNELSKRIISNKSISTSLFYKVFQFFPFEFRRICFFFFFASLSLVSRISSFSAFRLHLLFSHVCLFTFVVFFIWFHSLAPYRLTCTQIHVFIFFKYNFSIYSISFQWYKPFFFLLVRFWCYSVFFYYLACHLWFSLIFVWLSACCFLSKLLK